MRDVYPFRFKIYGASYTLRIWGKGGSTEKLSFLIFVRCVYVDRKFIFCLFSFFILYVNFCLKFHFFHFLFYISLCKYRIESL